MEWLLQPFLADPEADEKSQMINLFGSKLAEIVRWVQENVIEENKKCIIFSKVILRGFFNSF